MDESEGKKEEANQERRFSQEQYDLIKRCSDKKDMTEWNEWRKQNPHKDILLYCAPLKDFYLKGAYLNMREFCEKGKKYYFTGRVYLEKAHLAGAQLDDANLFHVHLWNADLRDASLRGADLRRAHLEDTNLEGSHLEGAKFVAARVDGATNFCHCSVDCHTDFSAVGLGNVRIEPAVRQRLEYNIRRQNWEEWYPKQNQLKSWAVRNFWEVSDYGISTQQVIRTFFKWAIVFAVIYYVLGAIDYYLIGVKNYPGPVANLFVDKDGPIHWLHVPLRSMYFSVVTMTTLGFGDMHANSHNFWWGWLGYLLLMAQVIFGYILLGALVTCFAVLFTAGGPAGKFAEEKKPKDEQKE